MPTCADDQLANINDLRTLIASITAWLDARQTLGTADELAALMLETGPLALAVAALQSQITSGAVVKSSWTSLLTVEPEQDGTGGEVLDTASGTHIQATFTGYDGEEVPDAGRYTWVASWGRWFRIGNTGLAGKADAGALAAEAITRANADTDLAEDIAERATLAELQAMAVIPLVSVGGTGNAATAALPASLARVSLAVGAVLSLPWPAANTATAPTLTIGGTAFELRRQAAPTALAAGDLKAGGVCLMQVTALSPPVLRLLHPVNAAELNGG